MRLSCVSLMFDRKVICQYEQMTVSKWFVLVGGQGNTLRMHRIQRIRENIIMALPIRL